MNKIMGPAKGNRIRRVLNHCHRTLIVGEPQTLSERHERAAFLHEFADSPQAELLRIRYRVCIFILWLWPLLWAGASVITRKDVGWVTYLQLISSLLSVWFRDSDNDFVRIVMKRRGTSENYLSTAVPHSLLAEKILCLILPLKQCEDAIGFLNELFVKQVERHGLRYARLWYWWQTLRSLSPMLDGLIERLIKWGVFAGVTEWLRHHL